MPKNVCGVSLPHATEAAVVQDSDGQCRIECMPENEGSECMLENCVDRQRMTGPTTTTVPATTMIKQACDKKCHVKFQMSFT